MTKRLIVNCLLFLCIDRFLSVAAVAEDVPEQKVYSSPRIAALARALDEGKQNAMSEFWHEVQGHAPLIELNPEDDQLRLLTYVWRGNANTKSVGILGDIPINGTFTLERFRNTDLWFRTEKIPKDARFGYKLCDGPCARDPRNPKWLANIGRSVVDLPDAPSEPWIREIPGVPKGTLVKSSVQSAILNEDRALGIYTPWGYKQSGGKYNLLIVFDGQGYGIDPESPIPTPRILDNLIFEKRIPPTIAILVSNIDQETRNRDLRCSVPFEDFLAKELVPWAVRNYHASDDSRRIIVAGSSLGGLSAACSALRHPEVFGNVLSQSGAFKYSPNSGDGANNYFFSETNWVAQRFASKPRLPIRFFLSIGRFEDRTENRRLRDVLVAKGNQVAYREYSGSHDALTWRNSLADGLIAITGADPSPPDE